MPYSAKTRKPLKLARVPQTNEAISAASGPKFTILWGHVGKYCCLTIFPIVDTCLSCEDITRQSCPMAPRRRILGDFFASCISSSRVHHISDLHSKFALRPYHLSKYGRRPIWSRASVCVCLCVCLSVCPRPYAHTTARTWM